MDRIPYRQMKFSDLVMNMIQYHLGFSFCLFDAGLWSRNFAKFSLYVVGVTGIL